MHCAPEMLGTLILLKHLNSYHFSLDCNEKKSFLAEGLNYALFLNLKYSTNTLAILRM